MRKKQHIPSVLVSVDRVEKTIAVVEADDGRTFRVAVRSFDQRPREGMMYRVPVAETGEPIWTEAVPDQKAEHTRKKEMGSRMDALRKNDTGGTIDL